MNVAHRPVPFGIAICVVACVAAWRPSASRAEVPEKAMPFVGAWTQNGELSSQAPNDAPPPDDRARTEGGRRGGGGGRRGGGGFGGGGRNGGFGGAPAAANPDANVRVRDAMRDITNPPLHLTIVATETMIVMTGPDGRTTRLSPDGKKIKDENTNVERKTKWDGSRLVCEISGLGPGKITETYAVDAEHHQLRLVAEMEGRGANVRTFVHVYDLDALK